MTTIARLCWPALTMALTFVLAACSAGGGGAAPDEARSAGGQRTPAATETPRGGDSAQSGASESSSSESGSSSERSAMRGSSASAGDRVEIRQAWVQVRNSPNSTSGAIALAFGNDTFDVVDEQGDWVRVRIARGREGWIPRSATQSR